MQCDELASVAYSESLNRCRQSSAADFRSCWTHNHTHMYMLQTAQEP